MILEELNRYDLNVSRETFLRLEKYVQLLLEWNQRINLIGRSTEDQIWHRHILDSLQLKLFLPDLSARIIDLGSGAGLPGAILAIAGYTNVTLVEKNSKKAAFLRNVSRETFTSFQVIENDINAVQGVFDVVTSRGLGSLTNLIEMSQPLLSQDGICVFLKGERADEEIYLSSLHWKMTIDKKPSITDPRASLLIIKNIEKPQEKNAEEY